MRGLQKAGVPVTSLRQNGLDYFDTHHTADDTLDKIDPRAIVAGYVGVGRVRLSRGRDATSISAPWPPPRRIDLGMVD